MKEKKIKEYLAKIVDNKERVFIEPTEFLTIEPSEEIKKYIKKDGRANNGGKRANAGNKEIDPNEKKIQCYFSVKKKILDKVKNAKEIAEKAVIDEYEGNKIDANNE